MLSLSIRVQACDWNAREVRRSDPEASAFFQLTLRETKTTKTRLTDEEIEALREA